MATDSKLVRDLLLTVADLPVADRGTYLTESDPGQATAADARFPPQLKNGLQAYR